MHGCVGLSLLRVRLGAFVNLQLRLVREAPVARRAGIGAGGPEFSAALLLASFGRLDPAILDDVFVGIAVVVVPEACRGREGCLADRAVVLLRLLDFRARLRRIRSGSGPSIIPVIPLQTLRSASFTTIFPVPLYLVVTLPLLEPFFVLLKLSHFPGFLRLARRLSLSSFNLFDLVRKKIQTITEKLHEW
jgi:hypothetical protein